MSTMIISSLRSKNIGEQARLLGCIREYITNDALLNMLQGYDLNNKDAKVDTRLQSQLNAFSGVPGLNEQIHTWLSSTNNSPTYYS